MSTQKTRERALCAMLLLSSAAARAAHFVDVRPAAPLRERLTVTIAAEVQDRTGAGEAAAGVRDYHLRIAIPEGTTPDVAVGSSVRVALPIVRHAEALARVTSVGDGWISLVLPEQVQQLEGLRLKASLPLKPVNLYSIPFQAVYSPRGIMTEAFVYDGSRVKLVGVSVLEIRDDGRVVVSSARLAGAQVVVDGLDNLVSGDVVSPIFRAQEARHD